MSKYILIAVVFMVAMTVFAAQPQRINAPGATGMNTDWDAVDLRLTDARYLLNTDTWTEPGVLKRRAGHVPYGPDAQSSGGTDQAMTAAVALYDPITKFKAAAFIIPTFSVSVTGYSSDTADAPAAFNFAIDSTYSFGTNDSVGRVVFTDKSGVTVNTVMNWWAKYGGTHDFEPIPDGIIYSNQSSPVSILSLIESGPTLDSVPDSTITIAKIDTTIVRWYAKPPCDPCGWITDTTITSLGVDTLIVIQITRIIDTIKFSAGIQPVSPEGPGTPRAFALDSITNGSLTGTFQYQIAPLNGGQVIPGFIYVGDSRSINVKNGGVLLTKFPRSPARKVQGDSTYALILRRDIGVGGPWYVIDTVRYTRTAEIIYIDTITAQSFVLDTIAGIRLVGEGGTNTTQVVASDTTGHCAGQLRWAGSDATGIPVADAWDSLSNYFFCYSLIDTLLNLESPVSIVTEIQSSDTVSPGVQAIGFIEAGWSGGYHALRLYRTESIDSVTDDMRYQPFSELDFYAVKDITLQGWAGVETIKIGDISDTALVSGSTGPVDADGILITRPPLISGLPASMRDVEHWNDRLWGIGDQEFPSRLWYTADLGYEDWPGLSYLDLDEHDNDVIVAMEKISVGNAEALLVFKRQKTFIVYGSLPSDVEFTGGSLWGSFAQVSTDNQIGDLTLTILVFDVGAIHKELVVNKGNEVYLATNDLEIVRFRGTQLDTISRGVRKQIKHALTSNTVVPQGGGRTPPVAAQSYSAIDVNARAMIHNEEILFLNNAADLGMSYNTVSGTWQAVDYSFPDVPWGTFKYDTVSTWEIFGDDNDLFFFRGSDEHWFLEADSVFFDSSTLGGYKTEYISPTFFDGGYDMVVQSLNMSYSTNIDSLPIVTIKVIGFDDSTLATSTLYPRSTGPTDVRIGFSRHASSSLRISISAAATGGDFKIYEITPNIARVGRSRIK